MNGKMWEHPATQENVSKLKSRGVEFIGPEEGMLACGYEGVGRFWKVDDIAFRAEFLLARSGQFDRVRFVVTAGPTREAIDPVRFISNRSSGKMGYAIAEAALAAGHNVDADLRSVALSRRRRAPNSFRSRPATNFTMRSIARLRECDVLVMCAAVADYKPAKFEPRKMKKRKGPFTLELVPTRDILASLPKEIAQLSRRRFRGGDTRPGNERAEKTPGEEIAI